MVRRVVTMVRLVVPQVVLVTALLYREARAVESPLQLQEVVGQQQTRFGLQLYSVLSKNDQSSNICFSPLSIGTTLAMVYAGSGGYTSQQMEETLGFEERRTTVLRGHRGLLRRFQSRHNSNDATVNISNGVYPSPTLQLRVRFASSLRRIFYANLKQLDFSRSEEAAAEINANVNEETAGRITELVDPGAVNSDTALLLMEAIHFKGTWLMEFDTNLTAETDFHSLSGSRTVQMMKAKKNFPIGHAGVVDSRVLKLPYKGEAISMLIVLPNKVDGIHFLDAEIHEANMDDLVLGLDSSEEVEVQLPRFKMEENIDLKETLKKMGLTDLFDLNKANLGGIAYRQQICVGDVIHKATIEVTEERTTAATATAATVVTATVANSTAANSNTTTTTATNATNTNATTTTTNATNTDATTTTATTVSAVGFSFRMLRSKPEPFIVDRPFFFVLRDEKTGASLFVGRVMEP